MKMEIPVAPLKRVIHKAGAERVSRDAAEELRDVTEDMAFDIAKRAKRLAFHAGRKTVTRDDIKLAARA